MHGRITSFYNKIMQLYLIHNMAYIIRKIIEILLCNVFFLNLFGQINKSFSSNYLVDGVKNDSWIWARRLNWDLIVLYIKENPT